MNVLIQIKETSSDPDILEYIEGNGNAVDISHSTEDSINLLSRKSYGKAVVSIKGLRDAAILKYMNEYYPEMEVVVIANKAFDDIISIFRKGNYSVIHEPLRLSDLKEQPDRKNKKSQKTINNINY